jgi:DNA (cytosine-5)-methyltransferase 1
VNLTTGSFCSGIAAPETAWHPLGWCAKWFSEIDPFASAVLAQRHGYAPNLGDMTKLKGGKLGSVDLVCAGTPCQSFSVAGLRGGMADPRGNLALIFLGLLNEIRPRWMVWENVPGVLSSWSDAETCEDGSRWQSNDFDTFTCALGQLGYGWAWRILDAQYFGVPQRRRRVFVVGYLGDWRRAAAVLFERYCLSGDSAPGRESGPRIAASVAPGLTSNGDAHSGFRNESGLVASTGETSHCLNAGGMGRLDYESETLIAFSNRGISSGEVSETARAGCHGALPMVAFGNPVNATGYQGDTTVADGDVWPCLPSQGANNGGGGGALLLESQTPFSFQTRIGRNGRGQPKDVADALTSCEGGTHADSKPRVAILGRAVRRLTPRECERLQGFPDDYTLIRHNGKPAADGPRYKALGNSMAVPVLRWIGERIEMVEAALSERTVAA